MDNIFQTIWFPMREKLVEKLFYSLRISITPEEKSYIINDIEYFFNIDFSSYFSKKISQKMLYYSFYVYSNLDYFFVDKSIKRNNMAFYGEYSASEKYIKPKTNVKIKNPKVGLENIQKNKKIDIIVSKLENTNNINNIANKDNFVCINDLRIFLIYNYMKNLNEITGSLNIDDIMFEAIRSRNFLLVFFILKFKKLKRSIYFDIVDKLFIFENYSKFIILNEIIKNINYQDRIINSFKTLDEKISEISTIEENPNEFDDILKTILNMELNKSNCIEHPILDCNSDVNILSSDIKTKDTDIHASTDRNINYTTREAVLCKTTQYSNMKKENPEHIVDSPKDELILYKKRLIQQFIDFKREKKDEMEFIDDLEIEKKNVFVIISRVFDSTTFYMKENKNIKPTLTILETLLELGKDFLKLKLQKHKHLFKGKYKYLSSI